MDILTLKTKLKIGDKIRHIDWEVGKYIEFPGAGEGWLLPNGEKAGRIDNPDGGWEYYKPVKNMKFTQAFKLLYDGGKIRRGNWGNPNCFIELKVDDLVYFDGGPYKINEYDAAENDWEIFEAPTYSFIELLRSSAPDSRFKRKSWTNGVVAKFANGNMVIKENGKPLIKEDYLAEDWIFISN